VSALGPRDVAEALAAFAAAGGPPPPPPLLAALGRRAAELLPRTAPYQAATTLAALAALGAPPPGELLAAIDARLAPLADGGSGGGGAPRWPAGALRAAELAKLAAAFAAFGVPPRGLLHPDSRALDAALAERDARASATLLWALASCGAGAPLLRRVAPDVAAALAACTPQGFALTLWACARLGGAAADDGGDGDTSGVARPPVLAPRRGRPHPHPAAPVFAAAARQLEGDAGRLRGLRQQALPMVLWAFSAARYDPGRGPLLALCERAADRISEYSVQGLSMLTSSLVHLGYSHGPLMDAAGERLMRAAERRLTGGGGPGGGGREPRLTPQALALSAYAFSRCGGGTRCCC
jgi:hypothetical protein